MSKNRIVCLGLLVAVLWLFLSAFPLGFMDQHTVAMALTAAVLVLVLTGQLLGEFESVYEIFDKPVPGVSEPKQRKMAPFAVIPALIVVAVVCINTSNRAEFVLKQEGIPAKATIFGGSSTSSTRRFKTTTTYKIKYTFKDTNEVTYTSQESVSSSQFNEAYEGREIDVVYWRKDPRVSKLLLNEEELLVYKKIAAKDLHYKDLLKILEQTVPEDSILPFLNRINYEWTKEGEMYVNNRLGLAIKIVNENQLAYIESIPAMLVKEGGITEQLNEDNFKKMARSENGKEIVVYVKDNITVITGRQEGSRRTSSSLNLMDIKMLYVYQFIHKTN